MLCPEARRLLTSLHALRAKAKGKALRQVEEMIVDVEAMDSTIAIQRERIARLRKGDEWHS